MTTLVLGATGATGKKLVEQLLTLGCNVKVIVRSNSEVPASWEKEEKVTIIKANVYEIGLNEMADHIQGCLAVASCLGHNLSFKGIYGKPRKLVTDAVHLLCNAIKKNSPEAPVKLVLMNTVGNRSQNEPISFLQKIVVGLIRLILPPHADNEQAAGYLRANIGQNDPFVQWVVVRPDSLTNDEEVTQYKLYASPVRSAIFNSGKTSRINVAHFMAELIIKSDVWNEWKGTMPVIYNMEE